MTKTRSEILQLYKRCMVYVKSLKYTDKTYLRDRIKEEFKKQPDDVEFQYEKGLVFLERARFV